MTQATRSWPKNGSPPFTTCWLEMAMKVVGCTGTARSMTLTALLLSACASAPPPPDWQASAYSALNHYTLAYLEGNNRVADFEFARVKSDIARTGRPDLMAKIELVRCATQVASLMFEPCTGYLVVAADAQPAEQTYADFLAGRWSTLKVEQLPEHYRELVAQSLHSAPQPSGMASPVSPLSQIKDPLARLVAASLLLKKELLTPVDIALALDSASSQGWRRPLLTWLGLQHKRVQAAGDTAAAASLQRRIDLVLQTPKP